MSALCVICMIAAILQASKATELEVGRYSPTTMSSVDEKMALIEALATYHPRMDSVSQFLQEARHEAHSHKDVFPQR